MNLPGHLPHQAAILVLAACTIILPIGSAPRALPAEPSRVPNVVVILTDDQGFGELGVTGNPLVHTPHIDRLPPGPGRLEPRILEGPAVRGVQYVEMKHTR